MFYQYREIKYLIQKSLIYLNKLENIQGYYWKHNSNNSPQKVQLRSISTHNIVTHLNTIKIMSHIQRFNIFI